MQKARRRRVPAFGEWNHYYYSDELSTPAVAAVCYAPDPEACSDVWFRYSPPPRKPAPKKVRRPEKPCGGGNRRLQATRTLARASDGEAATEAHTPAKVATARVVRPVDADLYQVPPPDIVPDEPRRRVRTDVREC